MIVKISLSQAICQEAEPFSDYGVEWVEWVERTVIYFSAIGTLTFYLTVHLSAFYHFNARSTKKQRLWNGPKTIYVDIEFANGR